MSRTPAMRVSSVGAVEACLNYSLVHFCTGIVLRADLERTRYLYRVFPGAGHVFVTESVGFQFWACRTAIWALMFRAFLRS